MRHDLVRASDKALAQIFDLVCRSYARGTARKCVVPYCECLVSKGRWQLQCAMITEEDNDTPVQSQSERDKTVAGNEGGSVRPTVGVELPWCQFAADRLATSHSISGCRGQIEMLLSYSARRKAVIRTEILFIFFRP